MTRKPGDFSARLVRGTLREFLQNSETGNDAKVLRIVRMASEIPPQQTSFGSEYVSWRETKTQAYCRQEDPSLLNLLRWNDVSMAHSLQWFTPTPHGFGLFFDIRSGSQWIVIAAPSHSIPSFDPSFFGLPSYFINQFGPEAIDGYPVMEPEAMLVTEGMRMSVNNTMKD